MQRVTLHHGESVTVNYTLATEALETLFRVLLVADAAQHGQPVGDGALDGREPALRKVVDEMVHTKLEPLLAQMIVQHKDAIPGIDLATALGL